MSLSAPAAVQSRLEEIENDLATRQGEYETAALSWFRAKRDREKRRAQEFMKGHGTVAERSAKADELTAEIGVEDEAKYEALKAVMRTLETRASIGQSILRSQARVG
jgi:hypothetical protein